MGQHLRLRWKSNFAQICRSRVRSHLTWRAKVNGSFGMRNSLRIVDLVESGRCLDSNLKGARDGGFFGRVWVGDRVFRPCAKTLRRDSDYLLGSSEGREELYL